MKRLLLFGIILLALPALSNAQCTTTNATSCVCATGGSTNCDLLPDMIVGRPPLTVPGNNGVIEYSQTGNGAEDGRLRISVSTPNIGHGPLEVRTTNRYICGTDTITGTAPATCPTSGLPPRQLVVQRVYHKTGNVMTSIDRDAGSMTYHPTHGHMHVDDWGLYTLRTQTTDPNPLNWPIVGTGAKLAFCLMDYGSCSTYNGHCVDALGNTLLNGNFPNYGLGGGAYNCSPVVQGISSGYTDIYYQYLDGMYINIPPGTCNGQYYIVVQLDPYNYFLEENENNNVLVVPYTLTQQVVAGTASITSSVQGPVCLGSTVTLSANSGSGFTYLWSNGATTQNINVTTPGNYTVSVTNGCGVATSAPFQVAFTGTTPVTSSASRCGPGSGTLSANASGPTIKWYAASTGGSSLGTGNSFITPSVNNTTSYYAEATTTIPGYSGPNAQPNANTIGAGGYYTSAQYQIFDAIQSFNLVSVKVYAQSATSTTVELRNSANTLLNSKVVSLPAGESRITLNWPITAGTDLRLTRSGSASLYRNTSGVSYPYTIANYLSIKNSSGGTAFYYFFYDWEISKPDFVCVSSRVASTLTVNPIPTVGISGTNAICIGSSTNLNASGASTYSWSPGTGLNTTTGASVVANPTSTTTYTVTGTNTQGCTGTQNITVTVNPLPTVTLGVFSSICNNAAALTLSGGSPSGGTYSGPGVASGSFNPATAGVGTHTITYSYTNGNGCSKSATSSITVNNCNCTVPAMPANFQGQVKPCPGSTYTYSVANNAAVVTYNWIAPTNATVVSGQGTNTVSITFNSSFTSGPISVTGTNACGTSVPRLKTVSRPTINAPGTMAGEKNGLCQTTVSLSVPAVTGAISYNWVLPTGTTYISGQGTTAITFSTDAAFVSGSVCVNATNGCLTSTNRCATIYSTPAKPVITGPATVCANQAGVAYSVVPVTGATSYTWGKPSTATIASGQGTTSATINFGASGGNVTCQAFNTCGKRGTTSKAVAINCRVAQTIHTDLYPNPASEEINVVIDSEISGATVIQLMDLTGRVIENHIFQVSEGENIIPLDVHLFSKGIYMMSVEQNGLVSRMKFIIE